MINKRLPRVDKFGRNISKYFNVPKSRTSIWRKVREYWDWYDDGRSSQRNNPSFWFWLWRIQLVKRLFTKLFRRDSQINFDALFNGHLFNVNLLIYGIDDR